jgi:hypothetical protein
VMPKMPGIQSTLPERQPLLTFANTPDLCIL